MCINICIERGCNNSLRHGTLLRNPATDLLCLVFFPGDTEMTADELWNTLASWQLDRCQGES